MSQPPSPYEAALRISNNLGGIMPGIMDKRAIDDILSRSQQAQTPEDINSQMNEVLQRITNKDTQKTLLGMLQDRAKQKLQFGQDQEKQQLQMKDYETIKNSFGDKFADIWEAAPQGGKTELLKTAIDSTLRGNDVSELLSGVEKPEEDRDDKIPDEIPQMQKGKLPENYDFPDFNKRPPGYTPKEWRDEKKEWRKENAPIYQENRKKLDGTKKNLMSTDNLIKLNESKELPEGFARIIINPKTGEPYKSAQLLGTASPAAQEWVKEIARFQNRAKDAFGARVTQFELMSFMKQFPNLLNTKEGRRRILEMMKVNWKMDELYQNALTKIYQKYGTGNIPHEKADELAQKLIEDETNNLYQNYLDISEGNQTVTKLSNVGYKKGDEARDTETGKEYIFNGTSWVEK